MSVTWKWGVSVTDSNVIHTGRWSTTKNPSVASLLQAAADVLEERALCKGHFALGRPDDKAKKDVDVFPWDHTLHAVNAVTLLGAICFVAGKPTSDPIVAEAYRVVHTLLRERGFAHTPEIWNDQKQRTKEEVVDLLRAAAAQVTS